MSGCNGLTGPVAIVVSEETPRMILNFALIVVYCLILSSTVCIDFVGPFSLYFLVTAPKIITPLGNLWALLSVTEISCKTVEIFYLQDEFLRGS